MGKRKMTPSEAEDLVEEVLRKSENNTHVERAQPNRDGDYCTVFIDNDVSVGTLKAISAAVGDEYMIVGVDDGLLSLFFSLENEGQDDGDKPEEDAKPAIPDHMRHREVYYDSEDVVIPGTEVRRGNTEQSRQITAWMKETGHYPIVYVQLEDGVHVEVSAIYDRRVAAVLEYGEAVGLDGRKYRIDDPERVFPLGSSICVRATCTETGRSDAYGLDFFA